MYTPTWTTSPNEGSWVFASTYLLILRYNHPNSDNLWQCSITEGCAVIFNEKKQYWNYNNVQTTQGIIEGGGWGVGHSCLLGSYISKSHSNSSLKRRINYHVIKEFANLPWKLGYPTKSFAKSLFLFLLYMGCGVCCASSLNTWFSMYMYFTCTCTCILHTCTNIDCMLHYLIWDSVSIFTSVHFDVFTINTLKYKHEISY